MLLLLGGLSFLSLDLEEVQVAVSVTAKVSHWPLERLLCDSVDTLSLLPWQLVVVLASFEAPEHAARILESIGSDDQGVGRVLHTLDRFP